VPRTDEDQATHVNFVSFFCLYFNVGIKGLVKTYRRGLLSECFVVISSVDKEVGNNRKQNTCHILAVCQGKLK
jgi:hypothetical protein